MKTNSLIQVQQNIQLSIEETWELLVTPKHIKNWYFAHESWHVPNVSIDLKNGGEFHIQMEAKDQSEGFDFWGTYQLVQPYTLIECELGDGRFMKIQLIYDNNNTQIIQTFEPESENSLELQREGWQAILNQLKEYSKK